MEDGAQVPGYDVGERLGAGSTATVWRARRRADGLDVALKVVPIVPEDCAPAMREASVLAAVRHEHVLKLYDVLALPGADGRPQALALALERAGGGSLAQLLAARGHLTPGEVVTVMAPLAGALADLHRLGVVHGDVSPGNVLFLEGGKPVLSDLGMARIVGAPVGTPHGTDGMVAPEVLEGLPPAGESDVYGLGALAWLCLTGESPGWVGTRPALAEVAPDVPQPLRDLVERCLAPEPEDRPGGEEAAVAALAAARPEPVELAPGADAAESLTRRLRDLARGDAQGEEGGPTDAAGRGRAVGRWAARAVAVVAVVALAWYAGPPLVRQAAAWLDTAPVAAPGPSPPQRMADSSPVTATAAPATRADGPAVTATAAPDPRMLDPAVRPVEVLQALLEARAAAWDAGDVAALAAAHAPGSGSMRQDAEALRTAADLGVGYAGVAFTVQGAAVVDGAEQHAGPRVVVLQVEVERAAYTVTGPGAGEVRQEGARVDTVTIGLERTAQGWRISDWS